MAADHGHGVNIQRRRRRILFPACPYQFAHNTPGTKVDAVGLLSLAIASMSGCTSERYKLDPNDAHSMYTTRCTRNCEGTKECQISQILGKDYSGKCRTIATGIGNQTGTGVNRLSECCCEHLVFEKCACVRRGQNRGKWYPTYERVWFCPGFFKAKAEPIEVDIYYETPAECENAWKERIPTTIGDWMNPFPMPVVLPVAPQVDW